MKTLEAQIRDITQCQLQYKMKNLNVRGNLQ